MKGFIRSLLGARDVSATPKLIEKARTARSALVKEWSALKDEERRLNDNWSLQVNSRLVDIRKRTQEIEAACVASHVLPDDKPMPEEALRMWQGRPLVHALNDDLDDIALLVLCAMLVKEFNIHYPLLAQEFVEQFHHELENMPGDQAESVREIASGLIWRFLAAFYEIGVLRALGQPMNVFVSANVRNVFAGLLYKSLLKRGYNDPGREWAQESLTNFVDGYMRNLEFYFDGEESHLAKVFAMNFSGGTAAVSQTEARLGEELDCMFARFVASNRILLGELLDGARAANL